MQAPVNCFSIIPAAGRSLRMGGRHKLLLPWNGATVMDQVLRAWTESQTKHVIVVIRRDDAELQQVCERWDSVDLLIAQQDPEDMKRSVQLGLRYAEDKFRPGVSDRWMVAPADVPTLGSRLINRVIEASRDSETTVAPRFGDRRGHPVSFPWPMLSDVFELDKDQGINQLLTKHPVKWLQMPFGEHPDDIDTPADYARLSMDAELQ